MFYRACVVGIVAFWLLMMALLVRVEFSVGQAGLMPVPPDYVWKLMFLHEQPSDLVLYSQRQRIGSLYLRPRRLPTGADGTGGPIRLLSGSGSLLLNLPGMDLQNVVLRGSMELDDQNTVQHFTLNASFHEPKQSAPRFNFVLDAQPTHDQWHYQLRNGDKVWKENAGTSAILMDALDLPARGIDSKTITAMAKQQSAQSSVTSQRGVLHTTGEDIEAYIVTVHHGESLESTIYVNQLGQILAIKTFGGYDLYDETLAP